MFRAIIVLVLVSCSAVATPAVADNTLAMVRAKGLLRCGVVAQQQDFDWRDTHGDIAAFGRDMCSAVAAAVLGTAKGLRIAAFPDAPHGLQALQDHAIDLLYGVSPRMGWAHRYAVDFGEPVFFEGQGVMVSAQSGMTRLADLANQPVCFIGNTPAEAGLRAAFTQRGIALKPFPFQETGEMEAALVTGHCKAETADTSALAADRTGFHGLQHHFVILPELLTLDPYVPAVRANDTAWRRAVDASYFTLVQAEQANLTMQNVAARAAEANPSALLEKPGSGAPLGLADGWRAAELAQTGNYGEIYQRDLGDMSPLRLPRGLNRPWAEGGMLWAPPLD